MIHRRGRVDGLQITGRERKFRNRRGLRKTRFGGAAVAVIVSHIAVAPVSQSFLAGLFWITMAEFHIREAKPEDVVSTELCGVSNVSNRTVANHPRSHH